MAIHMAMYMQGPNDSAGSDGDSNKSKPSLALLHACFSHAVNYVSGYMELWGKPR